MHRLLYASRTLIAAESPDMLAIADVALHRNAACGVTGYLYYDTDVFVQVLEGMSDDVEAIYASIQADTRHADLVTLMREPIQTRAFGEWVMGFYDGAVDGGLIGQAIGRRLPQQASEADAPALVRFLRDLSLGRDYVYQVAPRRA